MESTANGKSGYFYDEYQEAKAHHSARQALFIPFFFIEHDMLPFDDDAERDAFAARLLERKNNSVTTEKTAEPGDYLWKLWVKGATLEHIKWYVERRKSFHSHAQMASEAPSDDIECFTFSGHLIIDPEKVEENLPDPKDVIFYAVTMEARKDSDAYLVTGNIRHFPLKPYVVTPREMLTILENGGKPLPEEAGDDHE
jgi:hypothetical protein